MAEQKKQALTRYLILRSTDEGRTAEFIGDTLAASSEQALRKFFAEPPRDEESGAWFAAVSENALRWREVAAAVKTQIRLAGTMNVPADPVEPESLRV